MALTPLFADPAAYLADSAIGPLGVVSMAWAGAENFADGAAVDETTNLGSGGTGKALKQATATVQPTFRVASPELGGRAAFDFTVSPGHATNGPYLDADDTTGWVTAAGKLTVVTVLAWPPLWARLLLDTPRASYGATGGIVDFRPFYATVANGFGAQHGGVFVSHGSSSWDWIGPQIQITRLDQATGSIAHRINGTETTGTTVASDVDTGYWRFGAQTSANGWRTVNSLFAVVDGWLTDTFCARLEVTAAAYHGFELAAPSARYWGGFSDSWLPQPEKYGAALAYNTANVVEGATMTLANDGIGSDGTDAADYNLGQSTAGKQPAVATFAGIACLKGDGVDDGLTTAAGSGGGGGQAETLVTATTEPFSFAAIHQLDTKPVSGNKAIFCVGNANRYYMTWSGTRLYGLITTGGALITDDEDWFGGWLVTITTHNGSAAATGAVRVNGAA